MKARRIFAELCLLVAMACLLLPFVVYAESQGPGWVLVDTKVSERLDASDLYDASTTAVVTYAPNAATFESASYVVEPPDPLDPYAMAPDAPTTDQEPNYFMRKTITWSALPTFISLTDGGSVPVDFSCTVSETKPDWAEGTSYGGEVTIQVRFKDASGNVWWESHSWLHASLYRGEPQRLTITPDDYLSLQSNSSLWDFMEAYENQDLTTSIMEIQIWTEPSFGCNAPAQTYSYAFQDDGTRPVYQELNTSADSDPGETGEDVDAAIVQPTAPQSEHSKDGTVAKVAAGVGAALVGGALVGGSGKDAAQEDDKKKRYRMYFGKDFGDTLRHDAAAQPVYARMVEVDGAGRETTEPT